MLTAYDYTMARLLDDAGVDGILVGDSLGMVVQGQPNSLARHARRDDLPHARWWCAASRRSLLVGRHAVHDATRSARSKRWRTPAG